MVAINANAIHVFPFCRNLRPVGRGEQLLRAITLKLSLMNENGFHHRTQHRILYLNAEQYFMDTGKPSVPSTWCLPAGDRVDRT